MLSELTFVPEYTASYPPIVTLPDTCNLATAFDVPIPTLPVFSLTVPRLSLQLQRDRLFFQYLATLLALLMYTVTVLY